MKKRSCLRTILKTMLCALLVAGFVAVVAPPTEVQAKEPIQIKVIQSWPKPVRWNREGEELVAKMQAKVGDKIKFKFIGGPEVIPTFQQGEAVRNGVVDMYIGAINYYSGEMPEVDAMKLFTDPPWVTRKKGINAFLNKLHAKKLNAYYIGNFLPTNVKFHLYTTKPVKKMADFKGLKIRVTAIYRAFVEALGASPVVIAPPEVYTALERGTVDGVGWPSIGLTDLGWQKAIKYRIDPGFYALDGAVTMNLDKWNSLGPDLQKALESVTEEFERVLDSRYVSERELEKDRLRKAGITVVDLPADEQKKYVALAYKVGWAELLEKRSPKIAPKIKALLEK